MDGKGLEVLYVTAIIFNRCGVITHFAALKNQSKHCLVEVSYEK
jgi:hypothetical protein